MSNHGQRVGRDAGFAGKSQDFRAAGRAQGPKKSGGRKIPPKKAEAQRSKKRATQ
jgi:hypothetical protein